RPGPEQHHARGARRLHDRRDQDGGGCGMTVTDPAGTPPPAEGADRSESGAWHPSVWERLLRAAAAPVLAILFAGLATAIVLVASGNSQRDVWDVMTGPGLDSRNIVNTLNRAGPYYLSGIAVAIGFKMNLF